MPPRRSARIVSARTREEEEEEEESSSSSEEELMDAEEDGDINDDEDAPQSAQAGEEEEEEDNCDDGEDEDDEKEGELEIGEAEPDCGANEGAVGTRGERQGIRVKNATRSSTDTALREQTRKDGKRKHLSISLSKTKSFSTEECKVCGGKGHRAGFVGSVYMDCPNKPCYLCKQLGHTTATCPYRLEPGHGIAAKEQTRNSSVTEQLLERETMGTRVKRYRQSKQKWRVEAAILKLHRRRCCCLEFPPNQDGVVVSGDKQGTIAIWNYHQVHERTLYKFHTCLCNNIRFLPWYDSMSCASASSDGTVKLFDIETGNYKTLLDVNPNGWTTANAWQMVYGCDSSSLLSSIIAGDSRGQVHVLDPRTDKPVASLQLHKTGTKVVSIQLHPLIPTCILTAGNDHYARLFDVRKLLSRDDAEAGRPSGEGAGKGAKGLKGDHPAQLTAMAHPRVVNAAFFSPLTGQKILTTCQDNRIRVWDSMLTADHPADREIVHSHDFNRYLTPFKAEWDPKDPFESTFVCGRYISEDFGGVALHPVDIIDSNNGELLHQLTDNNLTTISPVNKPHPREDIIISGSSRSLYLWTPAYDEDEEEEGAEGQLCQFKWPSYMGFMGHPGRNPAEAQKLQKNDYFVFYDADPGPEKAKKKQKMAASAVQDWDDEE